MSRFDPQAIVDYIGSLVGVDHESEAQLLTLAVWHMAHGGDNLGVLKQLLADWAPYIVSLTVARKARA